MVETVHLTSKVRRNKDKIAILFEITKIVHITTQKRYCSAQRLIQNINSNSNSYPTFANLTKEINLNCEFSGACYNNL